MYDQNSNYFCSEVVVTYLSIIGAIDTNGLKHSTFLPNHFMPGGVLKGICVVMVVVVVKVVTVVMRKR